MRDPLAARSRDRAAGAAIRVLSPLALIPVHRPALALIAQDHAHPGRVPALVTPWGGDVAAVPVDGDRAACAAVGELLEDLADYGSLALIDPAVPVAVSTAARWAFPERGRFAFNSPLRILKSPSQRPQDAASVNWQVAPRAVTGVRRRAQPVHPFNHDLRETPWTRYRYTLVFHLDAL